jgi:hypothetical protein
MWSAAFSAIWNAFRPRMWSAAFSADPGPDLLLLTRSTLFYLFTMMIVKR